MAAGPSTSSGRSESTPLPLPAATTSKSVTDRSGRPPSSAAGPGSVGCSHVQKRGGGSPHEARGRRQRSQPGAGRLQGAGIRAGAPMNGVQAAGMKGAQRGCPQPSLLPFERTPGLLERCGHAQLLHWAGNSVRSIQVPQLAPASLLQGTIARQAPSGGQRLVAGVGCKRDADLLLSTVLQGPVGCGSLAATSAAAACRSLHPQLGPIWWQPASTVCFHQRALVGSLLVASLHRSVESLRAHAVVARHAQPQGRRPY